MKKNDVVIIVALLLLVAAVAYLFRNRYEHFMGDDKTDSFTVYKITDPNSGGLTFSSEHNQTHVSATNETPTRFIIPNVFNTYIRTAEKKNGKYWYFMIDGNILKYTHKKNEATYFQIHQDKGFYKIYYGGKGLGYYWTQDYYVLKSNQSEIIQFKFEVDGQLDPNSDL